MLQPVDTLMTDTVLLQTLQQNPQYDYTRELRGLAEENAPSLIDDITRFFERMFNDTLHHAFSSEMRPMWYVVAVVILIAAGIYIFLYKPALFRRDGDKAEFAYDVTDDDIYGIDFDGRIAQAVERRDHLEATRLTYLKTLRRLADGHRIAWALHKTPTQYTREERSPVFREMTHEFMRVRYGNRTATARTYELMRDRATQLLRDDDEQEAKGGDA